MKPTDLGLPPKFQYYRPGQYDAIVDMATSDARFFLASMPTGSGKSPAYISVARMLEARTLVLTANKGLQRQLLDDFGAIDMEDIRGQGNYPCRAVDRGGELAYLGRPGQNCDEGPCHAGANCSLMRRGCYYYDQVRAAAAAPLVVTNYAYWLTMGRWSNEEKIGDFDLLVLDEAHRAADILADFCSIKLDRDEVRILLGMTLPSVHEDPDIWHEWGVEAKEECERLLGETKEEFKNENRTADHMRSTSTRVRRIGRLLRSLSDLSKAQLWKRSEPSAPAVWVPGQQTDWVIEQYELGVQFLPVWAHAYAEDYLFRGIKRVILTSATLQPAVAQYLAIPPEQSEYRDYDSTFDSQRRPIFYIPTVKIDRHATPTMTRRWIGRMDEIIASRQDRKGIIMAHSYDWAETIYAGSNQQQFMVIHGRRNLREAVETFRSSLPPSVLVSPSVNEGFDFPGDDCRYIIIAKCPFADARSQLIQARHKSDKKYLNYLTSQAIIQQAGRGWRSADDWCEVFIIDDNIRWFWPAARKQRMWPGYIVKSYLTSVTLPDPPDVLTGRRLHRIRFDAAARPIKTKSQVRRS